MPPKKPQRNGFYYFMQEMMPKLKKEGHHFPRGMADVVPVAHPQWKALPQEEKDRYDTMAKEQKAKMRGSEGDKFRMDNTRTLISERRNPESELRQQIKDQRRFRQVYLNWRPGPSMLHERFFFIDFTSMCKLEDSDYYLPLEMAVAEYTMKDGIVKILHKFIDPGDIPLGYRFECQNKSDEYHKIPIEGFTLASSDYLSLWHTLENFVSSDHSDKDLPVFYCVENKLDETRGCLLWLLHQSRVGRPSRFKVHHMESMVQDLFRNAEEEYPPSEASIYAMLITSAFDYQTDVVCNFHEELDCKYCCLGRVRIYCYAVSDAMAPLYKFTLTSKHLPKKTDAIGLVIEPKPLPPERHLRQQVQPAYRGKGTRGRGYMPRRDQDDQPTFGGRDIRTREQKFVPDREPFDNAQMRHPKPTNPGIAAQLPAGSRDSSNPDSPRRVGASAEPGYTVPPSPVFADTVPSVGDQTQQVRPRVIGVGGPKVDPLKSPWMKPEVKKSFNEEFPTLGATGGGRGVPLSVGRGSMPPKEISLGRGQFTWGLAQPASTNTAFLGAGRGRGGWTPGEKKATVPPPPGILG